MKVLGKIQKSDDDKRQVFGWASVAVDSEGNTIIDSDGDSIEISELEKAAHTFVREVRVIGEMHKRAGVAELIESIVFTPQKIAELGIEGKVPQGWWVGIQITDDAVWKKVKSGQYSMFSIGGRAKRRVVDAGAV